MIINLQIITITRNLSMVEKTTIFLTQGRQLFVTFVREKATKPKLKSKRFLSEYKNLFKMLYAHLQHHNDTINKQTQEDFFNKYMYLSLYCKGSKRVTQGLRVRGSWRPNRNCNILTSTLMAVNIVSFSFF